AFSQIGDAYQESGEFTKAEEVYAKILKDYPNSSYADYAQYQLGLVYFQKGDYAASCDIFSRFKNELKDSPLAAQALYMLGTSLLNLKKPDEALRVFKGIPKLYPQDTELLQKTEYEIADCYYKLGQEKEAIARFKLLRAKYPDSKLTPEIMWWLGQYYYQHDDLNLARRYFSSLIRDFPDSNLAGNAFYALGLTFSDEGKPEQAAENFRMAIKLGPVELRAQATAALAESYYKIQDYEQAKLFYQKSLELANVNEVANLQFSLAEVLEAKGELDAGIGLYLKVSDLYADAPQLFFRALLRAANIYEDKEKFIEALKLYKRIVEKGTEEAKSAQER
ncbi:MAG: tetratricopeptide repeat protein, partial [Candidatus Omnitrophota bacterium]|nr:tetratricopeptide repeat protein [Candidatus Omnitrophota bacterium]